MIPRTCVLCSNVVDVSMGRFQIQCFTMCFVDMIKETSVTSHVLGDEWQITEEGRKQQVPGNLQYMKKFAFRLNQLVNPWRNFLELFGL